MPALAFAPSGALKSSVTSVALPAGLATHGREPLRAGGASIKASVPSFALPAGPAAHGATAASQCSDVSEPEGHTRVVAPGGRAPAVLPAPAPLAQQAPRTEEEDESAVVESEVFGSNRSVPVRAGAVQAAHEAEALDEESGPAHPEAEPSVAEETYMETYVADSRVVDAAGPRASKPLDGADAPPLSDAVSALTYNELRNKLRSRQLNSRGKKEELAARLQSARRARGMDAAPGAVGGLLSFLRRVEKEALHTALELQ